MLYRNAYSVEVRQQFIEAASRRAEVIAVKEREEIDERDARHLYTYVQRYGRMMTPREAGSKTDMETDRQLVVSHLILMKHPFLWSDKKEHAELLKQLDDFLARQTQIVTRSKSNRY
jgi:hypothetical protein